VVVNDTPENREVAGDAALYFSAAEPAGLAAALEAVRRDPAAAAERGRRAAERAAERYSWDGVADAYARLFERLAGR
jgi:glycosyltransferase involved in cell wall biosynthesis